MMSPFVHPRRALSSARDAADLSEGATLITVSTPEEGIQLIFEQAVAADEVAQNIDTPRSLIGAAKMRAKKLFEVALYLENLLRQGQVDWLTQVLETYSIHIIP